MRRSSTIALPSAQQALGFSNSDRQWVVTAYALSFGSLLLVGGRLGDMFSRKWVFITGLVGFALGSASGGDAVGLILGGVLTEYLSWRWCLYVNLAFAAIAVVGALAYIRGGRPAGSPRMDWPGAVLACAAPFAIVFGFSQAETAGWTATLTLGSLVGGVVLLAGFVVAERRVHHPLLPLRVIVDRTRGGAYVAVGIP